MIPYLQTLQDSISQQKELLKLITLKKNIFVEKAKEKEFNYVESYLEEDLEYIDAKIQVIKLENEISALGKIIDEKEAYFKKYAAEFQKDWDEAEKNFSSLFLKAKSSNNSTIKEFLSKLNHEMIEREPQTKVYIYKRLKEALK